MRIAVLAVLLPLLAASSASADVRLSSSAATVRALAAADGTAYAVLTTTSVSRPFKVVRSTGSGATTLGAYGDRRAGDPAIAAGGAGALLGWSDPVSGGLAVLAQPVLAARPEELAIGTGISVLAMHDDAVVAAFPDRTGDTAVAVIPGILKPARSRGPYELPDRRRLTSDAPEYRHRPIAVTATDAGVLVLDLVQTRTRTTLKVVGDRAPSGALTARGGLHTIRATLAADDDGNTAVAWASGGRVRLATARVGGAWRTRTLPGTSSRQPAQGAPAVAMDGGEPVVVWTSRPRGLAGRELYAWSDGDVFRLTKTSGDDGQPFVATRGTGGIFIAWTRNDRGREVPLLRRLG